MYVIFKVQFDFALEVWFGTFRSAKNEKRRLNMTIITQENVLPKQCMT